MFQRAIAKRVRLLTSMVCIAFLLSACAGGSAPSAHLSASECQLLSEQAPLYDPGTPRDGWHETLVVDIDGEPHEFGSIYGHYWRWLDEEAQTICGLHYNKERVHASREENGRLLYYVEGFLTTLAIPEDQIPQPEGDLTVVQVLTGDVPLSWLMPIPGDGYVYWHGTYSPTKKATASGFWLRHVAVTSFVFDMGGEPGYPFTHEVEPGIDYEYAPKLNFDRGP